MYCPVCFQDTLKIRSRGVLKLAFNDKARSNSLFTYNLQKDSPEELLHSLKEKIHEYMKWYSSFVNQKPIEKFEVYCGDFQCLNHCKIDMINNKFSVIGIIYSKEEVLKILEQEASQFNVPTKSILVI